MILMTFFCLNKFYAIPYQCYEYFPFQVNFNGGYYKKAQDMLSN